MQKLVTLVTLVTRGLMGEPLRPHRDHYARVREDSARPARREPGEIFEAIKRDLRSCFARPVQERETIG